MSEDREIERIIDGKRYRLIATYQGEDRSEDMFKDPDNWPRCPICTERARSQDANYWNIFNCPVHGKFTLGSGAIPHGARLVYD